MMISSQLVFSFFMAVVFRAVLGGCVIFMARYFFAHPADCFRDPARWMEEFPWITQMIRSLACFCLWGGCFILGTVIAVQIFGLHGDRLAIALVILSAIAAWFLLPKRRNARTECKTDTEGQQGPK
jgi:uncharacterized membrane-anchored protein